MTIEHVDFACLKYSLFARRRFLPVFLATFLGVFNDNLLRSGLVVLIAYSATRGIALATPPEILVTVCAALLIVPSLLFSFVAGALADKYEKSQLVRYAKMAELAIMCAAAYGFAHNDIALLMLLLFFSGTHTTFYSPIKFSILPEHLASGELLAGNGFMAAGGYLAMLLGMIAGGFLIDLPGNVIGGCAIAVACVGLAASLLIPASGVAHPETKIPLNPWRAGREIIAHAAEEGIVLRAILSLSWFLAVGSVYMSQFANYAQNVVRADNEVYVLFLTVFSVGIAAGSMLCDTLLAGKASLKLMPAAGLGVSVFTALMVYFTPAPAHEGLMDVSLFLEGEHNVLLLASMLMVAICGGIYMVPLYVLIQSRAKASHRSRVLAASNFSDSLFMTAMAVVCALMLIIGFGVRDLFVMVAVLNLMVAIYARRLAA